MKKIKTLIFSKNLLNPTSSRELKIISLYIKEAFEERDHPTVH